jgi:hypothetical protein
MGSKPRVVAVAGLVLILPAALFMAALVVRGLPQQPIAAAAQQLVTWYSERMWTLWVLLLLMPMAAFVSGCASLVDGGKGRLPVVATTLVSALILAIVVLHMAAN